MRNATDVLVIGGDPAGLAAAIAARKKGFSVTVADGAKPALIKRVAKGFCLAHSRRSANWASIFRPARGRSFDAFASPTGQSWPKRNSQTRAPWASGEPFCIRRWSSGPTQSAAHGTLGTTLHTVHGTLALKSGNLQVDLSAGTAGGEVIADAASGKSGNDESARCGEWGPKNPSNSLLQVDHSISIELELKGTIQAQVPQ